MVAMLVPLSAAAGSSIDSSLPILEPRAAAPSAAGAPFFPSAVRTDLVLARLDTLTQLDELRLAADVLSERSKQSEGSETPNVVQGDGPATAAAVSVDAAGTAETARILESRIAELERELGAIDLSSAPLLAETEQFGLGMAVFPVASIRKPFWNDWGRPRSGGRTHRGNDMLAQTGVELRAIEDGYVERTSSGGLGGLSIYLVGDSGSRYFYAHLNELADLQVDQRVYAGQRVGTVGDSGNATGAPHLHLQWSSTGGTNWENPFPLVDVLFGQGAAAEVIASLDEVPSRAPGSELLRDIAGDESTLG